MKRLFKVVDNNTGKMVGTDYFSVKTKAKELRNQLNDKSSSRFRVSRGPDHFRGEVQ